MKKIITDEQLQAILNGIFKLNAPVQFYSEVQKMLSELPEHKEVTDGVTGKPIETPDEFLPEGTK